MNPKILRDYLEKIRTLEADIYTIDEAIRQLQMIRKISPELHIYIPQKPELAEKSKIGAAPIVLGALGALGATPLLPIAAGVAVWKYSKVNREHKKAVDSYCASLEYYERQLEKNKEDEKKHKEIVEKNEYFNSGLEKQIRSLQKSKEDTEKALKRLYDLDIIYRKYRSIVPISMFCEYMDAGRRFVLEGTNGMYDLYEQELLGKQIVGELQQVNANLGRISNQLGSISNSLTGIQRNQILIYEEVAKGNRIAQDIRQGTQKMLESQERHFSLLEESTDIVAFNVSATARRTDALARIAEYEFAANHSPYMIL